MSDATIEFYLNQEKDNKKKIVTMFEINWIGFLIKNKLDFILFKVLVFY